MRTAKANDLNLGRYLYYIFEQLTNTADFKNT